MEQEIEPAHHHPLFSQSGRSQRCRPRVVDDVEHDGHRLAERDQVRSLGIAGDGRHDDIAVDGCVEADHCHLKRRGEALGHLDGLGGPLRAANVQGEPPTTRLGERKQDRPGCRTASEDVCPHDRQR